MRINWSLGKVLTLIATTLIGPIGILSMNGDFSHPSLRFFLVITAFGIFGILFVTGIQSVNPLASDNARDLMIQKYHFGAINLIALGSSSFVVGMMRTPRNWAWEVPMAFGFGAWIGVRLLQVGRRKSSNEL